MFTDASKIRYDSTCFLHTWNQCGDIPGIHLRIDRCINAALGHQGMLDAVADEAKLAWFQYQITQFAGMACCGRLNVARLRASRRNECVGEGGGLRHPYLLWTCFATYVDPAPGSPGGINCFPHGRKVDDPDLRRPA